MLHIGTSQHLPQTLEEIALRKPLFMTLYDLQCVAIHFNFGTHHRAENGSFGNVPFSVLVTTCTPTAWTFHFYLPLPPSPPTPKDDWNPNPKFFVGTLGKNEIRMGSFFGTFEKYRQRVQILSAPLNNKSEPPYSKTKVPGTPCYFPVLKLHPG